MKMKYNGNCRRSSAFCRKRAAEKQKPMETDSRSVLPTAQMMRILAGEGEYWGKLMRGACETYLYTRDEELYEILTESVEQLPFLSG